MFVYNLIWFSGGAGRVCVERFEDYGQMGVRATLFVILNSRLILLQAFYTS